MKRLWIGAALLLLVLAVGICLTAVFDSLHGSLAQQLTQAADAAQADNWEAAHALAQEADGQWQRLRNFTAAVADHEPLEEMDSLLRQLKVYETARDGVNFAAVCAQLSSLAEAIAQSQAITWWNLL